MRTFLLFMLGVPSVAYVARTCFDPRALALCLDSGSLLWRCGMLLPLVKQEDVVPRGRNLPVFACGSMGDSRRPPRFVR